jgi:hypothetical protein
MARMGGNHGEGRRQRAHWVYVSFAVRYFRAGLNPYMNRFERQAGLRDGGC